MSGNTPAIASRRHELNTLMLTMADAQDLAAQGRASEGYAALMAGLALLGTAHVQQAALRAVHRSKKPGRSFTQMVPESAPRIHDRAVQNRRFRSSVRRKGAPTTLSGVAREK